MGTVIKADGVGRIKKQLATLGLKDHMAEAQRVVRDARLHAAEVIEGARDDIARRGEEATRKGYERGVEEGRVAGESAGRAEAFAAAKAEFLDKQSHVLRALDAALSSFEDQKRDLLDRARRDVLVLAVAVAERIVKRTAEVDRQVVAENAAEALRHITDATDVVVRARPADMGTLRTYAAEEARRLSGRRHVRIVEDETIGVGGCVVESAATSVDATVEGQFSRAAAMLLGEEFPGWLEPASGKDALVGPAERGE